MTPRRIVALAVAGFAASAAALAIGTPAAPAQAATHTVQTSYSCQIEEGSAASPIATETMTLAMSLDVPASVAPGQSVALSGTLRLAFPEQVSQLAKGAGFTTASGYSDTMSLQVNGKTFAADRWQTPQLPIGDPLVVSAPISFPVLTVPNTPGGTLDLTMAQNVLKNPYFSSPASIAYTAVAQANGAIGSASFSLGCYLAGGQPSTLARIPIQATGATTTGTAKTTTQGAQTAQAGQTQPGAGAAGDTVAAATATRPTASATASGAAASGPTTTSVGSNASTPAAANGMTVDAAPAAAQRQDGVYIPTGLLVGIGAIICALAIMYAGWAHYRLHRLRRMLDD